MNVWSADERDEFEDGGLLRFIASNVTTAKPLRREDLENAIEHYVPWGWSHHFEVGPEVMFA